MRHLLLCLSLILLFSPVLRAQKDGDNNATRVKERFKIAATERNDIIFNRTFLPGANDEGVFLDGTRSGSYSLGVGIGIPFGRVVELKFEPRFTWLKLYYPQTNDTTKYFPSRVTEAAIVYEKQRMSYFEVPIGFRFKLARNARDNYKLLLEGGFSFGLNLGGTYKSRIQTDLDGDGGFDANITTKVDRVEDLELLRYGPYGRIGTNWIQIYAFYRMSDIFRADRDFDDILGPRTYPNFPELEIGLTLSL